MASADPLDTVPVGPLDTVPVDPLGIMAAVNSIKQAVPSVAVGDIVSTVALAVQQSLQAQDVHCLKLYRSLVELIYASQSFFCV